MVRERMSDAEVLVELRSRSLLNRVRQLMSASAGRIERAGAQRRPWSPVEMRRAEFTDAQAVIDLVLAEQTRPEPAEVAAGVEDVK